MQADSPRWYHSIWTLLAAALVVPPVGLVLNWMRPARMVFKILGTLAIAIWGLRWAMLVFGLRLQMDGTGALPRYVARPEANYAALERDRAAQRAAAPADEGPAPRAEAKPAPEPAAAPAVDATAHWTDFRGPHRDGHYTETPILTQWPGAGLQKLWQQPVGGGYASFVVASGKAFTIEQRRRQEVAAAYDVNTGRELWTSAWAADFRESMGGDGPRATPTWHDGRLYVLGAEGEFRCLDAATGRIIWRKNILEDNGAENLQWAMAAAPLVVDDKVIVLPGGRPGKSVAAYHRVTGDPLWKAIDDRQAYTSPILATLASRRQIVVVTAERAMGLTVEEGKLLWDYPWKTQYDVSAAPPLAVGPNRIFLSAAYGHGAAVVEIAPAGERFEAKTVWANNRMKNKFSGSVLHDGFIYGLDEAILACVDAKTGELKWKGGRYGYGQVLLAQGYLVITTESGEVVLVKASPESHQEIAKFPAVSGKTWNNPALAGGKLLVRNTTEMAAFQIAP